jgi:tetratricopeptide (TPR) repeat protein
MDNQKQIDSIMRLIRRGVMSSRFTLIFANCTSLIDQNHYMEEIRRGCTAAGITLTDVDLWSRRPIRNLREFIEEHLGRNFPGGLPPRLAIQVSGLEISILLDTDERSPAVLQTLNLAREGFREKLPYPLLIWLPDYAYVKLAKVAADFWSVRNGSYTCQYDAKADSSLGLDHIIAEGKDITLWQDKLGQIPLIERALEGIKEPELRRIPEVYTDLKLKLGDAYRYIGRAEKALLYYQEALKLSQETLRDLEREGNALNGLGLIYIEMGNFQQAITHLEEYLNLRRQQSKQDAQAIAYNHLGLVYDRQGDYERAVEHYNRALEIDRKLGKRREEGDVLGNLGLAYRKMARYEEAIACHEQALHISREVSDLQSESKDLGNIGLVYRELKDHQSAIGYFNQALHLAQQSGDRRGELAQLVNLGDAWRELRDLDAANESYLAAYPIAQETGVGELAVLEKLPRLYGPTPEGSGDLNTEIFWTEKLIERSRQLEDWRNELRYLEQLKDTYHRLGDGNRERECLLKAEAVVQKLLENLVAGGDPIPLYERLVDIYEGLHNEDKAQKAQRELETLKGSQGIYIWLEPGVIEGVDEEGNRPMLQVTQPYTFFIQVGQPTCDYSWIYHRDLLPLGTPRLTPPDIGEGVRISQELSESTTPSPASKDVPPYVGQPVPGQPESADESGRGQEGLPPVQESFVHADSLSRESIVFKFKGSTFDFEAWPHRNVLEKTLSLRGWRSSDVMSLILAPTLLGNHSISVAVSIKGDEFQDEFEVPLKIISTEKSPIGANRRGASEAIGRIGRDEGINALSNALDDKDSFVRSRAAEALGRIGSDAAVGVLIKALDDEDSAVRSRAAAALRRIDSDAAVGALSNNISAVELKPCVVRIRRTTGEVVGAGFLVGEKHILTCAHVVAEALGIAQDHVDQPEDSVQLDFPLLAPGKKLTAQVVVWQPPRPSGHGGDIAGLELDALPPPEASPARLVAAENLWGHFFRALGFPRGNEGGTWASGILLDRQAASWVQIEDVKETGYRVQPGFSGTPVWDDDLEGVVGMVMVAEARPEIKAAFVIPTDVLLESWPEMN